MLHLALSASIETCYKKISLPIQAAHLRATVLHTRSINPLLPLKITDETTIQHSRSRCIFFLNDAT